MIKSLQINNFQSHQKTIINFHSGVNYIIGDNDAGKSGIVDSFQWVFNNKPNGTEFISNFAAKEDTTFVTVEFNDVTITRERNNKINQYRVGKEEYKALAGKVPEEIAEKIQLNDTNMQLQSAPYFLLADTPGEISKRFNEVLGLEIIDTSNANIKSIVNKAKTDSTYTSERIASLKKEVQDLSWIEEANDKLTALEKKESNREILKEKIDVSSGIIDKISSVEKSIEMIEVFLSVTGAYDNLRKKNEDCIEIRNKVAKIEKILSTIGSVNESIKKTEIIAFESVVNSLLEKSLLIKDTTTKGKKIGDIVRGIIQVKKDIESYSELIAIKEDEYQKIMEDLKICPLCNQPIKSSKSVV